MRANLTSSSSFSDLTKGRTYPSATLQALMSFCEKNKIHLISDEVYALSTYNMGSEDELGFTSVLSINPCELIDENRLHVLYGMSKVGRC